MRSEVRGSRGEKGTSVEVSARGGGFHPAMFRPRQRPVVYRAFMLSMFVRSGDRTLPLVFKPIDHECH